MKAVWILALAVVLLLLTAAFYLTCTRTVPLDRVGIRSNLFGKGIEKRDLEPGLWVVIPGVHRLDIMDPTLQELSFHAESSFGSINLRTRDQYITTLEITLYYRIRPGHAWQVLQQSGAGRGFEDRFLQQATAAIWTVMGEMSTEDLYDSEKRTAKASETVETLNQALEGAHLEATDLLIRKIDFDPRFEQILVNKQIMEQRSLVAQSMLQLARQQEITQMIRRETDAKVLAIQEEQKKAIKTLEADTDANIQEIRADAELTIRTLLAEAQRENREMIAEGEKLKELARAKGLKALNLAYRSPGGNLLLSRRMIENLQLGDIEINTNRTNPFDVRTFLKLTGAVEE